MVGMMQRTQRAALAAFAVWAQSSTETFANDYPKRPVTIVVPTSAGSGPDVITRLVAERLSHIWGQAAVVSNRPGGGGIIATQAMAGVERNGYTLFMPIASTLTVNARAPAEAADRSRPRSRADRSRWHSTDDDRGAYFTWDQFVGRAGRARQAWKK